MPFAPQTKVSGDLIRSSDWNEAMTEVVRLEGDKLNITGGNISGPLAIGSGIATGTLPALRVLSNGTFAWGNSLSIDQTVPGNNDGPKIRFQKTMAGVPVAKSWSAGIVNGPTQGHFVISEDTGSGFGANRLVIAPGGNVGIGTPSPLEQLQIGDRWTFHNGGAKVIGYNTTWNGANDVRIVNGGASQLRFNFDGSLIIRSILNGAAGTPAVGSDLTFSNGDIGFSPSGKLNFGTTTRQMIDLWGAFYGVGVQASTLYFRSHTHFAWFREGVHHDNTFNPGGGVQLMHLNNAGDLCLTSRSNPSGTGTNACRALVDGGEKLIINWAKDYSAGTYIVGNANTLGLVGDNHCYIEFFPDGANLLADRGTILASRKGWMGYSTFNDNNLTIRNDIGNVVLSHGSDFKLKKDIKIADGILDKVMKVSTCWYNYKTDPKDALPKLGVIAQDILPYFPEMVQTGEDQNGEKTLYVDYNYFGIICFQAIRELKLELDSLKSSSPKIAENEQSGLQKQPKTAGRNTKK